ncbi:MmcQ/YjbR family DNA-binding protein [Amycolatopsis sp. NPDC088138]|uniref:MmcQ/YjbR family DNA-binding protein n=1 Tax=Amycolatopsis sp. NPDC088138 TaxID=3363938 RepID=UPI0038256BC1
MASWEDVGRIARGLPDVTEENGRGYLAWSVGKKGFAWERPLRKGDLEALGERAPAGPVLCAYVPDVGVKDVLIADDPAVFFTTPHFNGFPAILVELDRIDVATLDEVLTEAWLCRAPKRLAKEWLESG